MRIRVAWTEGLSNRAHTYERTWLEGAADDNRLDTDAEMNVRREEDVGIGGSSPLAS